MNDGGDTPTRIIRKGLCCDRLAIYGDGHGAGSSQCRDHRLKLGRAGADKDCLLAVEADIVIGCRSAKARSRDSNDGRVGSTGGIDRCDRRGRL